MFYSQLITLVDNINDILCLLAKFVPPDVVPLSELLELHRNISVAPFVCTPPVAHHEEAIELIDARIPFALQKH